MLLAFIQSTAQLNKKGMKINLVKIKMIFFFLLIFTV